MGGIKENKEGRKKRSGEMGLLKGELKERKDEKEEGRVRERWKRKTVESKKK